VPSAGADPGGRAARSPDPLPCWERVPPEELDEVLRRGPDTGLRPPVGAPPARARPGPSGRGASAANGSARGPGHGAQAAGSSGRAGGAAGADARHGAGPAAARTGGGGGGGGGGGSGSGVSSDGVQRAPGIKTEPAGGSGGGPVGPMQARWHSPTARHARSRSCGASAGALCCVGQGRGRRCSGAAGRRARRAAQPPRAAACQRR
jgi:hypothetical protein